MKIYKSLNLFDSFSKIVRIQIDYFNDFINISSDSYYSLDKIFKLFFPISIKVGNEIRKIEYLDFSIIKTKYNSDYCIDNLITYNVNIEIRLKFIIGDISFIKKIFLFSLPIITKNGFFIINGLKRVFLVQCVRSFGIHFNDDFKNIAKIFPYIGFKIVFFIKNNIIFVKCKNNISVNFFVFSISLGFFKNLNDFCDTFFTKVKKISDIKEICKDLFIIHNNKIIVFKTNNELKDFIFKNNINKPMVYCYNDFNKIMLNTLLDTESYDSELIIKQFASLLIKSDELLNINKSKEIINDIFFNILKYNLDYSGRFFMNKQLNINVQNNVLFLTREDIISIAKNILNIFIGKKKILPIDHLMHKTFRSINHLLYFKIFKILLDYQQSIKDTLFLFKDYSKLDDEELVKKKTSKINKKNKKKTIVNDNINKKKEYYFKLVNNLFNFNYLNNFVMRFFTKNELCQLLDDTNELSILSHISRQTFTGHLGLNKEYASFKIRDLKSETYSRICPVQTPENVKIGLNFAPVLFSELYNGNILAPYYKVVNGKVLKDKIFMLDLFEEIDYFFANYNVKVDKKNNIIENKILCRYNEEFVIVDKNKVNFVEYSNLQTISISAALIPFFSNSDGNRILLSTNHYRQVIPVMGREIPIVKTGLEKYVPKLFNTIVFSPCDGIIEYVDSSKVIIKKKNNSKEILKFRNFTKNNKFTFLQFIPLVKVNQKVSKGELLADNLSTKQGILSLGYNANIAIMPFYGFNYEDSIIISDEIRQNDIYTSYTIREITIDILMTKYGPEICSNNVFNVSDNKKEKLGDDGIVKIGSYINNGDLLLAKLRPIKKIRASGIDSFIKSLSGEELTKNYEEIFYFETTGISGTVVDVQKIKNIGKFNYDILEKVVIKVINKQLLNKGDKLAGRYGNKSIVSKFLPMEDMPYTENGERVHIILSPLSIISRMNVSQLVEMHYNLLMKNGLIENQDIIPFDHFEISKKILDLISINKTFKNGKIPLYDGLTGELFKNDIVFGKMYFMKLEHMVYMKKHSRSIGPYNKVTEQPTQGKTYSGGQRLSNLYISTLLGYGANNILREMYNFRSDDVYGRCDFYKRIIKNKNIIKKYRNSEINKLLKSYLNSLGLDIEIGEKYEKTS
jgi:DNA-directed RNA polymerase beta subunit